MDKFSSLFKRGSAFSLRNQPEIGQNVYHRRYGVGEIVEYDGHWLWVKFGWRKKRFEFDDKNLKLINLALLVKLNASFTAEISARDGKKVKVRSIRAFKKATKTTKAAIKREKEKYCSLTEVAEVLKISVAKLKEGIEEGNIPCRVFGKRLMIHRKTLLRMIDGHPPPVCAS